MDLTSPKNWKTVKLGDVTSKMFSGGTPSTQNDGYYGGNIPWLRTQEVNFNYIYDTDIKITEEGFEGSSAKWVPANSVIVAMYGNSAGRVAYSTIPLTTNQACCNIVVDPEKTDAKFLYFTLLKDYIKLENMATGGAQQNLSVGVLKDYEIHIPESVEDQREIAAILGSLDDKTELLRRENKTLESIAQALFREWFVEFKFPGYEGVKVDGVPEGWKTYELRDIFQFAKGKKPLELSDLPKEGFLPQILIENLDGGKNIYAKNEKVVVCDNTNLLMVMDGASSGRIEFGHLGIVGSTLSKLDFKIKARAISYFYLKSIEKNIRENTTGSAIPHTDKEKVYLFTIALPSNLEVMENTFSGFMDKMILNRKEIQSLSRLRDQLLDKIFSN